MRAAASLPSSRAIGSHNVRMALVDKNGRMNFDPRSPAEAEAVNKGSSAVGPTEQAVEPTGRSQ
jgi:hypothetical protein